MEGVGRIMEFDPISYLLGAKAGGGGGGNSSRGSTIPSAEDGKNGDIYARTNADGSQILAIYWKSAGAWHVIWTSEITVVQYYLGDSNAVIEYPNETTMVITYTPAVNDGHGIVFTTKRWNPLISINTDQYNQMGRCTKSASLPTIVTAGTGRDNFNDTTGDQEWQYVYASTINFFVACTGTTTRTVTISKP